MLLIDLILGLITILKLFWIVFGIHRWFLFKMVSGENHAYCGGMHRPFSVADHCGNLNLNRIETRMPLSNARVNIHFNLIWFYRHLSQPPKRIVAESLNIKNCVNAFSPINHCNHLIKIIPKIFSVADTIVVFQMSPNRVSKEPTFENTNLIYGRWCISHS